MKTQNLNPLNIIPNDEYNQNLISKVHPENWQNPTPKSNYDLIVIGAGTAGLVVAAGAAGLNLGLKIALIEKHLMGGDCLNFGCVPSKAIIRSARVLQEICQGKNLGINVKEVEVNFSWVMERMRQIRAGISHHDSAERFKNLGVDVFFGEGQFLDDQTIEIAGEKLSFKKAVIATGGRAKIPEIEGIKETGFLTNETVFSLTELPKSLAVIGGGAIGCELSQVFQSLGAKVTLFHKYENLLNKEDNDVAKIIENRFIQDGINIIFNAQILKVEKTNEGKLIHYVSNNIQASIIVEEILIAAGRTPNLETLNLDVVGVKYDRQGVKVNDYLETTNSKILAAGDICSSYKFTHTADAAARIVIKNSLFSPFGLGKAKFSDLVIPWVTYTTPEVAHVGKTERELQAQNIEYETIKIAMSNVDRAIADEETEGFVKIHHQKGSDKILGATIVASHAGEMISEITAAMVNNIGLNGLSKVIHSYPTQADGIKKAADAYRRKLLTPTSQKILKFLTYFS